MSIRTHLVEVLHVLQRLHGPIYSTVGLAAALLSLLIFSHLEATIVDNARTNGSDVPDMELRILDRRYGYSVRQVRNLLGEWGSLGTSLYLIIQVLDLLLYIPGYTLAFTSLFNGLTDKTSAKLPATKLFIMLPALLGAIDVLEDVFQILSVLLCTSAPEQLRGLLMLVPVLLGSACNKLKWNMFYVGVLGLLVIGAVYLRVETDDWRRQMRENRRVERAKAMRDLLVAEVEAEQRGKAEAAAATVTAGGKSRAERKDQ